MIGLLIGGGFCSSIVLLWLYASRKSNMPKPVRYVGHVFFFGVLALPVLSLVFHCAVQEPLSQAASAGNEARVRQLLRWGARPNVDFEGSLPLVDAVEGGNIRVVCILLAAGADPNSGRDNGYSALHVAKANRRKDIEQVLRKAGATD